MEINHSDLEKWFEILWSDYPLDLAQNKKGSKQQALKAARKLNPNPKEQTRILGAMREMARICRLERKQLGKTDRWPFLSTWLNQERFEMLSDMERPHQIMERAAALKCECGNDVAILDKCNTCYDRDNPDPNGYRDMMRAKMREIGLTLQPGETRHEYNQRCRAYALKNTTLGRIDPYRS